MAQREQPPKSEPVTADPNPPPGAVVTGASVALPAKNPSWFTPRRLLTIFCIINLINYMDRGAIASNGVNGSSKTCKNGTCSGGGGIQGTFNLSNFEDGALSSAFMVGLLVSSPIFATLAKSYNPFRLIGVGLTVWTVAIIGCGCSFSFWFIALCRMFVGVGEASFISLAAPFIDDNAPVEKKAAWLSMFYMCMPTGYAIGYMYGGEVGSHFNWRIAFWGEAVLMLPFVILSFVMKPLDLKGFASASHKLLDVETAVPGAQEVSNGEGGKLSLKEESGNKSSTAKAKKAPRISTFSRFIKDMKTLLHEKVFVINVLGYICYNFVIGAYSYWGPKAGKNIYNMKSPDLTFGGVTVVCGVLGTVAGGYALDRINSTLSNAFKLLTVVTFFGAICCFAAFCFKNIYIFLGLFAIGELLVFATQGPVNYICLHCVKPSMRPLSMAMSTVSIHIFGDVPSSPLFGVLQDHTQNWRLSTLILTSIFLPAVIFWFIGIFLHSVDRFNEAEDDGQVTTLDLPKLTLDLPKPVQGKETENIEC